MTNAQKAERDEAIEFLRARIVPGDRLYTTMTHVSSSGMSRSIKVILIRDNDSMDISGFAGRALGWRCDDRRGGVKVSGCGMDMGFHIVYSLSSVLFPNGHTCTGKGCPSNDHNNGDRNYRRHNHQSGGYAIRHSWM